MRELYIHWSHAVCTYRFLRVGQSDILSISHSLVQRLSTQQSACIPLVDWRDKFTPDPLRKVLSSNSPLNLIGRIQFLSCLPRAQINLYWSTSVTAKNGDITVHG